MQIPFSQTHFFSKLILDYIDGKKEVADFYTYRPTLDVVEQLIEDKQKENIDRNALVNILKKQYDACANLALTDANIQQIQTLGDEQTFCVVTAHQLNIFGGPLYFIYKIAQTISTCNQLKIKFPQYHFVPIYWMGSEDHDFEEINHVHLYNKKIEWTDKQGGITGAYQPSSITACIDELETILGAKPFTSEIIDIIRKAYTQPTLALATRYLVHKLFGEYGLVIVDGNDAALKTLISSVIEDELLHQNSIQLVTQQLQALESKGYKQQAFPRKINLFYISQNSRERIEWNATSDTYNVLNTTISFSQKYILDELKNFPERFSPNVILRPLYQQKVLPSIAYIGGAGELAYWLQLKLVFDFYKVQFPQLLLRNSALLYSNDTLQKIEKLNLSILDFFADIDAIKNRFATQQASDNLDVSDVKSTMQTAFEKLQTIAQNTDASLVNTVGAELQKTLQSVDALQKRFVKSLKQKNETELNRIEKIKSTLFPNQSLQERVENFSVYYAMYGPTFITDLIQDFDVYHKQFLLKTLPK